MECYKWGWLGMITLLVNDLTQITLLEVALQNANIEYEVVLDDGRYGIDTPYLLVYNTPLDNLRALKWIGEQSKDE
jgi:hypothetical protein